MAHPIIDAAQALAGLLRAAEDAGLPAPYDATAKAAAPHKHPASDEFPDYGSTTGGVHLLVYADEFDAWATWIGGEPFDNDEPYRGAVHRHVNGYAGPVPLQVTTLVPVAEEVSA